MKLNNLISIQEAQKVVNQLFDLNVSQSNISYLIQYGLIRNFSEKNNTRIDKQEITNYYKNKLNNREITWKNKLGQDLNWELSFENIKEKERTKHVHRLHPYKGKFIPQLVEYFLNDRTNSLKKEIFFQKGDIVLDPFCGSGTTLVQANELGLHAIGIEISEFNSLISNVKVQKHDLICIKKEINRITQALNSFYFETSRPRFEKELKRELSKFNNRFFPSPGFRFKVKHGYKEHNKFGKAKAEEFKCTYDRLLFKYKIQLEQTKKETFLDKWYLAPVRSDINFVFRFVSEIKDLDTKNVLSVILSRTIRSCRATTHTDLATLVSPVQFPYYCRKHYKICIPLFSIVNWWNRYSKDTINRLAQFDKSRTETFQICITGDSTTIDLENYLKEESSELLNIFRKKKIKGIFSSPPYVGLINYHDQHAYSYDLFGFKRRDRKEIGPLFRGNSEEAKKEYVKSVSDVLANCKKYLSEDASIFIVANDKYELYPKIFTNTGLKVVEVYKRPVLHRTEKDKSAYSEKIFHLKVKNV